jgi:hypothetical protein
MQQNLYGLEVCGRISDSEDHKAIPLYGAMEFYRVFLIEDWGSLIQHLRLHRKILSSLFHPGLWAELWKRKLLSEEQMAEAQAVLFIEEADRK